MKSMTTSVISPYRRTFMRPNWGTLASGFTLIELMVVLVILSIVVSMVSLSISAATGRTLENEAERLSATLEEVRWQAVSTGRRVAWEPPQIPTSSRETSTATRWYEQTQDGSWRLRLGTSSDVAPLLNDILVTIVRPRLTQDALHRLVLGPEPVGMSTCILLTKQGNTVSVVSNGIAPFSVQHDDHCRSEQP